MSLFRRRRDDGAEPGAVATLGPATSDDAARQLDALLPDPREMLAEGRVPAVRLAVRREPDAGIDIARSKFGGAPDHPRGMFWPRWTTPAGEERLLQFFAQIDLAEVAAAAPSEMGLPPDGLLSFFADFDPAEGVVPGPEAVAVVYAPADSLFTRSGLRMVPLPTAELHPVGMWSSEIPTAFDAEQEAGLRARAPEHYQVTARHQLGGHSATVDRAVLLQFDSDDTLEIAWGPEGGPGRLAWTIPNADLASRNWAAAALTLDA